MARTYPLPTMCPPARPGQGHSHVRRIGAQPVSSTDSATAVKVAAADSADSAVVDVASPTHEDWTRRQRSRSTSVLTLASARASGWRGCEGINAGRSPGVIAHGTRSITPEVLGSGSVAGRDYPRGRERRRAGGVGRGDPAIEATEGRRYHALLPDDPDSLRNPSVMYQAKTDPRNTCCAMPLLGASDRSVSPAATKPAAVVTALPMVIARELGDRRFLASTKGSSVQITNVTMLAIACAESDAVASGSFVGSGQDMSLQRNPPARIVPTPATRSSARGAVIVRHRQRRRTECYEPWDHEDG